MSWVETTFEKLYSVGSRNGIYKPSKYHGRGTKIVNMGELFGYDFICNQPMKLVELTPKETGTSSLSDGDLLFGRRSLIEAGAGKCSLVVGLSEATTFESSIIRVRPDKKQVNPRYLYYFFRSPVGRGRISAIVTGTNVKGIRGSELSQILVRMPAERNVQDRIADVLQNYDDLIATNTRRIELLERSARLLFEEWFVRLRYPGHEHDKIVDGVPEGWSRKTLGDIAQTNAESVSNKNLPNEITYIDIASVKEGCILAKTRLTSEEAPGRARRRAKG